MTRARGAPLVVLAALVAASACVYEVDLRTPPALRPRRLAGEVGVLDESPAVVIQPKRPRDPPAGHADIVQTDPLGDGSATSWLFRMGDEVWLGPSADGATVARFDLDGVPLPPLGFSIAADDVAPGRSRNRSGAPFASFGAPGCVQNTTACGPDNEDGAVIMGAAVVQGREVVVAAGGRSNGDLGHVYVGARDGDVVRFSYVDLSTTLDAQTLGVSSISNVDDRLVLGLPDRGRERPRLVELLRVDPTTGVDARETPTCDPADGDVCDLAASQLPGFDAPPATLSSVDAIVGTDRVVDGVPHHETWVAGPDGLARCDGPIVSATAQPSAWTDAAPSSTEYVGAAPVRSDAHSTTPLRDRAVPGVAIVDDVVLFGSNTEGGAQLWRCAAADCAGDAWSAVPLPEAADRVALVLDAPGLVVVGLEAADGAHIFESEDGSSWTHLDDEEVLGSRLRSALVVERIVGEAASMHLWVLTEGADGPAVVRLPL